MSELDALIAAVQEFQVADDRLLKSLPPVPYYDNTALKNALDANMVLNRDLPRQSTIGVH